MRSRWTDWLIVAFVAFQLVVPLTYYLRDDPYDERFAWRMFSGVRLLGCRTEAMRVAPDGPERIDPRKLVHAGWVTLLRRNRRVVIDAFLERQCEDGVTVARLNNYCTAMDGEQQEPIRYSIDCGSRVVTVAPGDPP